MSVSGINNEPLSENAHIHVPVQHAQIVISGK